MNANQEAALRKIVARPVMNGRNYRHFTALELGIAGRTLRSLADLGYMTVGTAVSSIRRGDRNTYALTTKGLIRGRQLARHHQPTQHSRVHLLPPSDLDPLALKTAPTSKDAPGPSR